MLASPHLLAFGATTLLPLRIHPQLATDLRGRPDRQRPEEHFPKLVVADHTGQFGEYTVIGDQRYQQNLDSPEMRPIQFDEQFMVGGNEAWRFLPVVVQALQVMHDQRHHGINGSLPACVPDQWLLGKAIDERQMVGE
jgi:hypothetical protein